MDGFISAIDIITLLKHIIKGITDDSHEIKMINFMMLQRLALSCPAFLSHRLEDLIPPLRDTLLFKQKTNSVKLEIERNKDLARSAARTCFILSKLESPKFVSFVSETRSSNMLMEEIFGAVEMEVSTSSISRNMDGMEIL